MHQTGPPASATLLTCKQHPIDIAGTDLLGGRGNTDNT